MNQTAITDLVDDRISPIAFREADVYPGINYNTRGIRKLGCRGGEKTRTGVLEIGLLAGDEVELERLADTVTDTLDGYEGEHLGYILSLDVTEDDFDEKAEEIDAFYKALQFDFIATKIN